MKKPFKISLEKEEGQKMQSVLKSLRNIKNYATTKGFELLVSPNYGEIDGFVVMKNKVKNTTFENDQLVNTYEVKKRNDILLLFFAKTPSGQKMKEKLKAMGPIKYRGQVRFFEEKPIVNFSKISVFQNHVYFSSDFDFCQLADLGFEQCSLEEHFLAKQNNEIQISDLYFNI